MMTSSCLKSWKKKKKVKSFIIVFKLIQSLEQGFKEYLIEETGARLNTNWASELLQVYCVSHREHSGVSRQPKYITYNL